jgi:proliferating cell nuclear antigen
MIVKLDNPKLLADAIGIVSELVSEVKINLLEEGMSIVAVDPANVAMVVFKFPRESFSEYEAGNEVWGVSLEDLKQILKRATTSSSIVIGQEDNHLNISIFDKVKRNFTLSLTDIDSEDKKEPQIPFACKVEMNSDDFSQSIEDCSVVADSCALVAGEEFFMMEAAGSLKSFRAEFSGTDVNINGIGKSRYSLEYLLKFIKAKKISQKVVVNFSDDMPVRIDFPGEKLGIGFILAPRVEND